ncbi:MAG: FkbM family methyltransferase [Rhodothermales bacterium]|nr:FkbM family methyltransferase [Rhodothermales bacterium]
MFRSELVRFKRFFLASVGRDVRVKRDIACPSVRFGSEHAGWHVIAGLLGSDSLVYSFGVGEDVSFDVELIEALGVTVHAFDPTPRSIRWVASQDLPRKFNMHDVGIAAFDGTATFSPPEDPTFISHTILAREAASGTAIQVNVRRLSTLMSELGHRHLDILKMDVEGAEYEVIEALVSSEIRPAQILVEFHHRFPEVSIESTETAIEALRSIGYRVFHVSPRGEEISFVRGDLVADVTGYKRVGPEQRGT